MKNKKIISLLVLSTIVLSGCSVTMRGTVTDITTGNPIQGAQVEIKIEGKDEPRTLKNPTGEDGKYRIKKDDKLQEVSYVADGYETFSTEMEKVKNKDVYLVPTAEETARRIVQAMIDKDYDTAYMYLHPNYQALFTREKFEEINKDFETYLGLVKEFRIAETKDKEKFKDEILQKTYIDVKGVTAVLVMNTEGNVENTWEINLIKMKDQNDKEYWHWIFNRTSNT